jgi:phage tail-like protein
MAITSPPVGFHYAVFFRLEAHPLPDIRFQEVSGLEVTVGTESLAEGGENRFSHQLPTRPTYGKLVFKRSLKVTSRLTKWIRDAIEDFEFQPAEVLITLLNDQHLPVAAWVVVNAYPIKWSVTPFKAQENSLAIESMELTCNYFRRIGLDVFEGQVNAG